MDLSCLAPGQIIDNTTLMSIFKCASQGGMRKSNSTNTLVLISNHLNPLYDDRWVNDVFYYTGMGQEGDQEIKYQNKTLVESKETGVSLYLFEVFKKSEFTFIGEVELADPPFQEKQLDKNKELRKVWVFPLRIKRSDAKAIVKKESIEKLFQEKLKKLKKLGLTNEELLQIIQSDAPKSTSKRTVLTNVYERDPKIVEAALRRAGGICQLCEKEAPFMKKNNEPYLEVHHIVWLSKGGSDTLDNTVALCPNCHRKMHALNLEEDILKLKNKAETPLV